MNLDDLDAMRVLDTHNLLAEIDALPGQIRSTAGLSAERRLPGWSGLRQVVIAGMGASASAADLFAGYVAPLCSIPVQVHSGYGLPAAVGGEQALVILCSHSGETEETLFVLRAAQERGCRVLAITTGGALKARARAAGLPCWEFAHAGQPALAVGIVFSLLLDAFTRLGLMRVEGDDLATTVNLLESQRAVWGAASPVFRNPAKRMAGQLMERWVVFFGSDLFEAVARRWKAQINTLAKAWAQAEALPEADHSTILGMLNPQNLQSHTITVFLQGSHAHPRNLLRADLTREVCLVAGMTTDVFQAPGSTRLQQLWSAIQFGDYAAYYLAIAYSTDPAPLEVLEQFKQALREAPEPYDGA